VDGQAAIEIERPRTATDLFGKTLELYLGYPVLFFTLAAVIVVPWLVLQVLSFALLHDLARTLVDLALTITDYALVLPLVAAFHVHAVDELRAGEEPTFRSASRRGLATLSRVSPAVLVSWLGTLVGFVFLIVPGVILMLRWAVVAQAAALSQGESYEDALDESTELTRHNYGHVLGLLVCLFLFSVALALPAGLIFGLHATTAKFLVDLPITVLSNSFWALGLALLYFDLSARYLSTLSPPSIAPPLPHPPATVTVGSEAPAPPAAPAAGNHLDPESWSDEDRPAGWYVLPAQPHRMRYWVASDEGRGWTEKTTRTPRRIRAQWRALKGGS
jgi:hypothetical protein